MIEKDNIQELFSKAFENHASAVKPELWTGVQAKMAAAGVTGGAVAVKGISALTKWIIGTAAVTTIGVTTYVVVNNNDKTEKPVDVATLTTNSVAEPASENDTPNTIALDQKENNPVGTNANATNSTSAPINDAHTAPMNNGTIPHSIPVVIPVQVENYVPKSNPTIVENGTTHQNTTGATNTNTESSPATSNAKPQTHLSKRETLVREPMIGTEVKEAKVEVPNVFTPNFDRSNDYFELISEENVSKVEITILDPNGKKVFVSNEKDFKWDGTNMSNEPCAQGIYSYQMVYFDLNGKANLKGDYIYLQR